MATDHEIEKQLATCRTRVIDEAAVRNRKLQVEFNNTIAAQAPTDRNHVARAAQSGAVQQQRIPIYLKTYEEKLRGIADGYWKILERRKGDGKVSQVDFTRIVNELKLFAASGSSNVERAMRTGYLAVKDSSSIMPALMRGFTIDLNRILNTILMELDTKLFEQNNPIKPPAVIVGPTPTEAFLESHMSFPQQLFNQIEREKKAGLVANPEDFFSSIFTGDSTPKVPTKGSALLAEPPKPSFQITIPKSVPRKWYQSPNPNEKVWWYAKWTSFWVGLPTALITGLKPGGWIRVAGEYIWQMFHH